MERRVCFALAVLLFIICYCKSERGDYIGCYMLDIEKVVNIHTGQSVDVCLSACEQVYYKYALIGNHSMCFCGNAPGTLQLEHKSCNTSCPKNETQVCGGDNAWSVYDTEVTAPGPPASVDVHNVTETTLRVHWTIPSAYSYISAYIIQATVLQTYSDLLLIPLEWRVSNDTYQSELLNLQPGSIYNISVAALNQDEEGANITIKAETRIGTPDPSPPDLEVKSRHGDRMVVRIPQAKNVNGPVSMYRIVVSIELYQQGFIIDTLGNYSYAKDNGLPYYITAELDPDDIEHDFIVGDRITYNGFFNAPLPLTNDIDVSLGVVSEKEGQTKKIRYAESTKKIILNINEPEEVNPLVVILGAGIAIGVMLLLIGVGLLIILRKKIHMVRLQRGSQSMPLSLSEPCMEIENSGFIQDEDERVDYYSNLKRKLWNIPRNFIDIDNSCVVGLGSYGKFTKGKVQQGGPTPALVQVISDRELEGSDKKMMLQELDLLIKSNEHENVLSLIGICETNTTLFVVLEDMKLSLKEMLLQSRQRDLQNNKFCLITENKVLQICVDIARGMEYLHSAKVTHKRLCCRNIVIAESGVAKVSGFGLSHIRPLHETPDYTRWTSHEMLRQSRYNPKADVWSFGCLMWEAFTMGATPYAHSGNKDVTARILRGMRPSQPSYVGDELFQLCLQCWQVDPDERPTFLSLLQELRPFAEAAGTRSLSFTHYNGFDFEPHIPQYEIIS